MGWGGRDWIDVAEDRDRWSALRDTYNVGKFQSSRATGGFSGRTQLHGVSYVISVLPGGIKETQESPQPVTRFQFESVLAI
jgi:hypothetical protein